MNTQVRVVRTLTEIDHVRLSRLASRLEHDPGEAMQALLDESDLVPSVAVSSSVITMYTQVLLQQDGASLPHKVTLCYPDDADPAQGFISVLSPLGASLIGLKVGDVARWRTPAGDERSMRVVEVLFQPEASGDYTT